MDILPGSGPLGSGPTGPGSGFSVMPASSSQLVVRGSSEKLCAYNERRRVNLKFCLADFVHLIQELRSNCSHLSNKYATIAMSFARLLNHVNKIHQTEL